jgi:hypothetical protein
MAIVTVIKSKTQSKTAMRKVMEYVVQDEKTLLQSSHDTETGQSYRLISGQNCVAETAQKEFMATKILYGKDTGIFYKHYVQSFKPDTETTPQEIHQIAVELAEYFKGFEVLIATHIDDDHWHSHLIVNSVNAETGLKIQFNEKSLNELRQLSDKICKAHGLETLKPYEKTKQTAGISTREYRAAEKGDSWKFRLINAIDTAMEHSHTKGEFIAEMDRMGYGVKWIEHYKYITYTTPEGRKCRDNRLHEEKYLKERMEGFYEHREVQVAKQTANTEQAGHIGTITTGEHPQRVSNQSADLRSTVGGVRQIGSDDDGNSGNQVNRQQNHKRTQPHSQTQRAEHTVRFSKSYEDTENRDVLSHFRKTGEIRKTATNSGQHASKLEIKMARNRGGNTNDVVGTAVALESAVRNKKREIER